MEVSAVNSNKMAQKGKNIGTMVGLGTSAAYIIKNRNDIFVQSGKEAAKRLGSKNKGIAIATGVTALLAAGVTLIGRLLGSAIGKIIDKKNSATELQ